MDAIRLRDLRVYTHVGCTAEERRVGQHLEIDVEMRLDLREAGTTDRIDASLDYAEAARRIHAAVGGIEVNLIETVAERAAAAVLALGAREVVIRVRKPAPPIPGLHVSHAEVEIARRREEAL